MSIAELAALATPVHATLSVNELPRFVEALAVEQRDDAVVECRLDVQAEGSRKVRIFGELSTSVLTQCQRCLEGLPLELTIPVDWNFPDDVQGDAAEDANEIDVRLLDCIEDDLLLGIPLFARHADENCGGDLVNQYAANDEEHTPETVTPFKGLKDLLSKQ